MPPKFKFTREEITSAALDLTRRAGLDGLTARALAEELGCSVKPIFGLFKNMEEAEAMLFRLVKELAEKEGVTEALKAEDGMKWVRAMSNIRNRAAEVVYNDLIYN